MKIKLKIMNKQHKNYQLVIVILKIHKNCKHHFHKTIKKIANNKMKFLQVFPKIILNQ